MLTILASLTLLVLLALSIGFLRERRASSHLTHRLLGAPRTPISAVDLTQLDSLPAPVARYLRHVLRDNQRCIGTARIRQVGELRTDITKDRWFGFEASQLIVPPAPGFVWDAKVSMAPLLHVRVHDAYVDGLGSGRLSLLSAVRMAGSSSSPEVNEASLHRYLAESPWYPTALLPGPALKWSPISDTKALATLASSGTTVSLEFWFNEAGEVSGIYTPGRWMRSGDAYVPTPWEGRFTSYQERGGMLVPTEGEVGWYVSGTWQPVWRGSNVEVNYTFDP
jgi:hypothetical protein